MLSGTKTISLDDPASWPGPRTVNLKRCGDGFGFTLRHFIVYPPDSAVQEHLQFEAVGGAPHADTEGGIRKKKSGKISNLEPMDTIFVKHVKEGGPAQQAGLNTGDRIVSVNGESVTGKTYSQVIALIQQSKENLQLLVVPKDEDVLQLAYQNSAYSGFRDPYRGSAAEIPSPPSLDIQSNKSLARMQSASYASLRQQSKSASSELAESTGSLSSVRSRESGGSSNSVDVAGNDARFKGSKVEISRRSSESALGKMVERFERIGGEGQGYSPQQRRGPLSQKVRFRIQDGTTVIDTTVGHTAGNETTDTASSKSVSMSTQTDTKKQEACGSTPREESFVNELRWAHRSSMHLKADHARSSSEPVADLSSSRDSPHLRHLGEFRRGSSPHGDKQPVGHPLRRIDEGRLVYGSKESVSSVRSDPTAGIRVTTERGETGGKTIHIKIPKSQSLDVQAGYTPETSRKGTTVDVESRSAAKRIPVSSTTVAARTAQFETRVQKTTPTTQRHSTEWEAKRYPLQVRKDSDQSSSAKMFVPETSDMTGIHYATRVRVTSDGEIASIPSPATEKTSSKEDFSGKKTSLVRKESYIHAVEAGSARATGGGANLKKTLTVNVRKSSSGGVTTVTSSSTAIPMETASKLSSGTHAQANISSSAMSAADHADHSAPACNTGTDHTVVVLREKNVNTGAEGVRSTRRSSYLMATSPEADQLTSEDDVFSDKEQYHTPQRMPSIRKLKSFFGENTPKIQEATEESLAVRRSSESATMSVISTDVIKEGWLNYRQSVNEKGKRVSGAKWKEAWAVLKGNMLYVCKERRAGPMTVAIGDEHPISIKGSIPDIAYDYTKRKNVFRLLTHSTVNCVEYLFQAENHDDMLSWISAIQNNSGQDDEEAVGSRELILKRHTQYGDLLKPRIIVRSAVKLFLSPQATGRAAPSPTIQLRGLTRRPKGSQPSPSTFRKAIKGPEDYVGSVKTKQNWKEWFRKLGPKTSSSPEPIGMFCVHLEECTPSGSNEYVPLIVELCCTIVEAKGLEVIGIYRIPGNSSGVAHLQEELNKGIENINLDDEKWGDTNIISSLLKSFFRKLPDPLVTNSMYGRFIEANRHKESRKRMWALRELVHALPDHHFETLKFLVLHLKKVSSKSYINKMEVRNLAIVFGPTLVRTTQDNMAIMIQDMSDQCRIVESIIRHSEWFFDPDVEGKPIPVDPTDIDPVTSITQLLNGGGGGRVEEVEVRPSAIGDSTSDNTPDPVKKISSDYISQDVNIQEIVRAIIGAAVVKQQQALREEQQQQLQHSYSDDEEGFSKDYFTRGIRLRRSFQPRKSSSSEHINLNMQDSQVKVCPTEELKTPSRHNSESSLDMISKVTEQLDRSANASSLSSRKMHYYAVSKHQPYSPDLTRDTSSPAHWKDSVVTRRPLTGRSTSRATFSLSQHYYSRYDLETRARQMKENYKRHKVIPDKEYIERQHRQAIKDLENEEGGKEVVNDILSRSAQQRQIVIKLSDVTKEIAELSQKQDELDDGVEKSLPRIPARLDGNHPKADVASVTSDYSTTSSSNFATLESKRSTSSSFADTLNTREEKRQRSNNTSDSLSHQDSDLDSNLELDFAGNFDDHLKKLLDPDYDFPSLKKDSDPSTCMQHVKTQVPNKLYDRTDGRTTSLPQQHHEHRRGNVEVSVRRSSRQNTVISHSRTTSSSKGLIECQGNIADPPTKSEQEMIARNAEEARRYRKKLKSKETEDIKGGRQRKSVRRRHTLGGGKDFPEYRSLNSLLSADSKRDNEKKVSALERLKPQCASRELSLQGWIERERLRNSTPNLTLDSLSGGRNLEVVDIDFEGRSRRISSPDLSDLKNRKFTFKSSKDPHPQKLTKHVAKFYDIESYL
ncbi:rho GTPase-activating protein 23-like isoform X2 [Branchiostoma lanceolatum]|uniref:rho GTPase-activating protein 23-like isoform X2 n=1 Tax=Branchiostoma lanceolatum TaxID=7740 RepID=UPI00345551BA